MNGAPNDARSPGGDVLRVSGLRTEFATEDGPIAAVDGVSFSVLPGEIFGIVGESGSGKSVTAYSILGLVEPPGRIVAGEIRYRGHNLVGLSEPELREIRGARIAMVFQDPMTSLHPLLRIEEQMVDAVRAHRRASPADARGDALSALERVGTAAAADRLRAYPHQLSGGMRQRVAIAIAMLNKPDLIIADEPTTALDVTTQAQIIQELKELCRASGTALVWITHDLAVIAEIADRVAVMYAGSIVESGPVGEVLGEPLHPYTAGLLGSVPSLNRGARRLPQISGSVQSAFARTGCRFAPRCARATEACDAPPAERELVPGRWARCFHPLPGHAAARQGEVA
jgi:peptide/nickel transport system ATP-binding protein